MELPTLMARYKEPGSSLTAGRWITILFKRLPILRSNCLWIMFSLTGLNTKFISELKTSLFFATGSLHTPYFNKTEFLLMLSLDLNSVAHWVDSVGWERGVRIESETRTCFYQNITEIVINSD